MLKILSIADVISISNACLGLFSVLILLTTTSNGLDFNLRVHISFSLILLAVIFDGLDGIVARRTWKSEIGLYIDSMADMTSLIIAPAIFIYFVYFDVISCCINRYIYLWIALILFLSFGIIRLVTFKILKKEDIFIGLPSPASTIILLILAYIKVDFIFIMPAIIIIAAAMASSINFPKPRLKMDLIASILIIITIILGRELNMVGPLLLLSAILVYAIGGPVFVKIFIKKQ
jgi:phosphatidylserine synthase